MVKHKAKCKKAVLDDPRFWALVRVVVIAGVAVYVVSTGYQEGWVTRADLPNVLKMIGSVLGVDLLWGGCALGRKKISDDS